MNRLSTSVGAILLFSITGGVLAWGQHDQMLSTSQGWLSGPTVSGAFYIEQRQWPTGYSIRLNTPNRRTADIHIGVEANNLFIHMAKEERLTSGNNPGQVFMQFGHFSHWLNLPVDADMNQIKLTSYNNVVNIFIPRKR